MSGPVLEVSGLIKDYRGLRPLRLQQLSVEPGEHVAITGLDQPAAEILINLLTGTMLPDRGEVRILGRATSDIQNSDDWLTVVDRFGIVSERAVLLESLSVAQNLAMPFSIDIEPMADELRARAATLASEAGLKDQLDRPIGSLEAPARLRARLARALALDPAIVLFEHPSAGLARADVAATGGDLRQILARRSSAGGSAVAALTLTADPEFAEATSGRVLALDPATGRLTGRRRGWFFGRGTASL